MIDLKYHSADNGNCRVYYKALNRLYCWQITNRDGDFELLVCSRDGEPSHKANETRHNTEPPKGDELIEDELRTFLGMPA